MMVTFLIMMWIPLHEMWILKQPLMGRKRPEETQPLRSRFDNLVRPEVFHPETKITQVVLVSVFF